MKQKILLAGGTGYLGRYIAAELLKQAYPTRLIVRNKASANFDTSKFEIIEVQVTQAETIGSAFEGVDVVISTLGITRQKDGLTYMDVDYQANKNLLDAAKKAGVKKFIYIGVLNGEKLKGIKIIDAKEKFVAALKVSGMDYTVIRPNGFFSDMRDFLDMGKGGRVYLFGHGNYKLNPIHGADLAELCVDAIEGTETKIEVGGPEILSHNQLALLALKAHGKKIKITHLPDWIRRATIFLTRTFTSQKIYGPIEFFMTAMASDNIAPQYGKHRLEDFFNEEVQKL